MQQEKQEINENNHDIMSIMKSFVKETFEIFIIMCMIRLVLNKELNFLNILRYSLLLGVVVILIGFYNKDFKKTIKGSMVGSMSARLITMD